MSHNSGLASPGILASCNTIFLDMGSTLAKLNRGWQGVYHQVFQEAGHDFSFGDVEAAVSQSWSVVARQDATAEFKTTLEGSRQWQREVEERVMEQLNIHLDHREDLFWKLVAAFDNPSTYELYPEVLETLAELRARDYRLAIISNWSWHLPALCDALGLSPYFEQIFTSARVGYAKPNPRIFQYALEKMEIRPNQGLHIGDSLLADVEGANSVGLASLWLVRPEEQPLYDEQALKLTSFQATGHISNLTEILMFLNRD